MEKARSACDQAVSTSPGLAEGYTCLGNVYRTTGEYEKAVAQFQKATTLDPTSDETFPAAGRLGLPIFIGLRSTEIADLQAQLGPYRDAWREAGHAGNPSVFLRIPVYVSPTAAGAVEEPRESLTAFFARQTELARLAVGRAGAGPADRRQQQAQRMASLTYEDMLERKVAFGTPAAVVDRLSALRDQLGLDGVVVELNPGGRIAPELETRSLRLLTSDVLPALRGGS